MFKRIEFSGLGKDHPSRHRKIKKNKSGTFLYSNMTSLPRIAINRNSDNRTMTSFYDFPWQEKINNLVKYSNKLKRI